MRRALAPLFCALLAGCGASATPAVRTLPNAAPLVIGNDSSGPLCGAFLVPTGSAGWGSSRLGEGELVGPRHARTFFVDRGSWDVLLSDCGGGTVSSGRGIRVNGHLALRASNLTPIVARAAAAQPERPQPEQDQPEQDQSEQDQPEQAQPEQDQPERAQPEQPQPSPTLPTFGVTPSNRGGTRGVSLVAQGPAFGTTPPSRGPTVGVSPRAGSATFGN